MIIIIIDACEMWASSCASSDMTMCEMEAEHSDGHGAFEPRYSFRVAFHSDGDDDDGRRWRWQRRHGKWHEPTYFATCIFCRFHASIFFIIWSVACELRVRRKGLHAQYWVEIWTHQSHLMMNVFVSRITCTNLCVRVCVCRWRVAPV